MSLLILTIVQQQWQSEPQGHFVAALQPTKSTKLNILDIKEKGKVLPQHNEHKSTLESTHLQKVDKKVRVEHIVNKALPHEKSSKQLIQTKSKLKIQADQESKSKSEDEDEAEEDAPPVTYNPSSKDVPTKKSKNSRTLLQQQGDAKPTTYNPSQVVATHKERPDQQPQTHALETRLNDFFEPKPKPKPKEDEQMKMCPFTVLLCALILTPIIILSVNMLFTERKEELSIPQNFADATDQADGMIPVDNN